MTYDNDNIFAKILRGEQPAFTVFENENCLAFLDVMPQADGHTLVLPKTPATDLFDLDPDAARELIVAVQHVARGVRSAFEPDGIRLMQLNGTEAGQSVFHIHMHIVPCYAGRPMRGHGRDFAAPETLEEHAAMIRKALAES
ncbi:MAG: HIT family protein [Gammaproteobacteria bacterium]